MEHSRYRDIAADMRVRIRNGEWEPGANLPRMKDLATEFGANPDTVGRAIAVLESEGLVWAVPRRGTIVRHGLLRRRRMRGNLVKRNVATGGPGYSFPRARPGLSLCAVGWLERGRRWSCSGHGSPAVTGSVEVAHEKVA